MNEIENRIEELNTKLDEAVDVYLCVKAVFNLYPCIRSELGLRLAANRVSAAINRTEEALRQLEKEKAVTAPHFILRIETPNKILEYEYVGEYDAFLAYKKACLDMKLSRKSTRVSLSRGDTVFKSTDLM